MPNQLFDVYTNGTWITRNIDDADVFIDAIVWFGKLILFCSTLVKKLFSSVKSKLLYAYCVAFVDISCETCGIIILTQFVLLGEKLYEEYAWNLRLIHIVTFCLNYPCSRCNVQTCAIFY